MSSYVLTVTLNPALDQILVLDRSRTGRNLFVESVSFSAGGKGVNVSRALKLLNVRTLATGIMGGTGGEFCRKLLDREGIRHDFLSAPGETRTNVTMIMPGNGKMARWLAGGGPLPPAEVRRFRRRLFTLAKPCRFVLFCGSLPAGTKADLLADLMRVCQKMGKKVILDASGQALSAGIKAVPFLIKPNQEEAESLFGVKLNSPAKWKTALLRLRASGIAIAIISLGRQGAVASWGHDFWWAQAPRVRARQTVGSGDVLLAGFMKLFLKERPLSEALGWAVAAATASTLQAQPGRFDLSDMTRLFAQVKLRSL